jgi:hypothetical protein
MTAGTNQPQTLEFWRDEVLRRAGQGLQGRVVVLFEADERGVRPVATSLHRPLPAGAAAEVTASLRSWNVSFAHATQWVACRLDVGRWCIAPVRTDIPLPPPGGVERRKKERMTLELAGLCLGLIERAGGLAAGG